MATTERLKDHYNAAGDDVFLARMQAQCEAIEAYRLNVMRRENRTLSLDQAAREWIERYAQSFSAH